MRARSSSRRLASLRCSIDSCMDRGPASSRSCLSLQKVWGYELDRVAVSMTSADKRMLSLWPDLFGHAFRLPLMRGVFRSTQRVLGNRTVEGSLKGLFLRRPQYLGDAVRFLSSGASPTGVTEGMLRLAYGGRRLHAPCWMAWGLDAVCFILEGLSYPFRLSRLDLIRHPRFLVMIHIGRRPVITFHRLGVPRTLQNHILASSVV